MTKDGHMNISELRKEANTKCPSTDFLFLIVTSPSLIKKKLQMGSFSHVELAYDVAMRRYIPVNIIFTSLTKEQYTILII